MSKVLVYKHKDVFVLGSFCTELGDKHVLRGYATGDIFHVDKSGYVGEASDTLLRKFNQERLLRWSILIGGVTLSALAAVVMNKCFGVSVDASVITGIIASAGVGVNAIRQFVMITDDVYEHWKK